jgi:hypothetical protein
MFWQCFETEQQITLELTLRDMKKLLNNIISEFVGNQLDQWHLIGNGCFVWHLHAFSLPISLGSKSWIILLSGQQLLATIMNNFQWNSSKCLLNDVGGKFLSTHTDEVRADQFSQFQDQAMSFHRFAINHILDDVISERISDQHL